MVRSISAAVSNRIARHIQPAESHPQAPGTDSGYFWHMQPDVSDEVARKITKASAWMAWSAINRQVHQQRRRGKTASIKADAKAGRIGIGLRQLARSVGADVSTVRRQCHRLEKIGLIVMHRPSTLTVHDPDTGRITTKSLGRCKATMIYLTVTEAHGRPCRDGGNLPPSPSACKVQSATTSREEKNIYPPCVDAVGIGSTIADGQGGLPAAEAGRHPPAEASQEGPVVLAVYPDAAGLEVAEPTPPPCLPRRSKAAGGRRAGPPAKSRSAGRDGYTGRSGAFPEDHAEPRPFTGTDAERFAATKARLEAGKADDERRNPPAPRPPSGRQKRQEAACQELREAASKLTAEQTEQAIDYRPDPLVSEILAVAQRKRAEMGLGSF